MANMTTSEARKLLGLPASGRVSPRQLQKAHEEAMKAWTVKLSTAISGEDRRRARSVICLLDSARDLVKAQPGARTSSKRPTPRAPSAARKPKQSAKRTVPNQDLMLTLKQLNSSLNSMTQFFGVPKAVIVLVILLFSILMLQGCAFRVARLFHGG
jgi:hypothetical protein